MDITVLGEHFAKDIAGQLVKKGANLLRDAAFGPEETRALTNCLTEALASAVSALSLRGLLLDEEVEQQAEDAIKMILRAESTANAFISAAVLGHAEPRGLTALATSAGLDPATLPFSWEEFLSLFLAALEEILRREASAHGSVLWGRVALGELFRIHCGVTQISTSVMAFVERLTAELCQVAPTASFDHFMYRYLGLPGRPKPFGGRQHEIDLLNNWLWDPQGRPKLLLVAPAGRGKSALLVHWLRQLPQQIAVAFVPVNLQDQTADPGIFLPALAIRLARLHGENLPSSTLRDATASRIEAMRLMRKPLQGRPLVVVIDGLDEAGPRFPWGGLFPNDLPLNVRFVVAARQLAGDHQGEEWMSRLGWGAFREMVRPLELSGLDESGLREVLEKMQVQLETSDEARDLVSDLFHLTKGDPLLIGLYADAMWTHQRPLVGKSSWRPIDLKTVKPGLEGFFQHWLDGQRRLWGDHQPLAERQVRAVLAILAQAIGPLKTSELRELMSRAFNISSWSVADTIAPIARFLIGDGVTKGYVYSHPRLAEFFGGDQYVGQAETNRVKQAFLVWGLDVLDTLKCGNRKPDAVPSYLLSWFAEHLARAGGNAGTLMSLLSEGWLRSWERIDPTHRGFLGDVRRAREAAHVDVATSDKTPPIPAIAHEFQCLLCATSVQSPHELPAANVFAAALETETLTPIQVLSVIASMFDRPNFEEHVRDVAPLISGAEGLALTNLVDLRPASYAKVTALLSIAAHLQEPDSLYTIDKAFRAARGCTNEFEKVYAAIALIPHEPAGRRQEVASRAIERIVKADRQRIFGDAIKDIYPYCGSAILPWARQLIEDFFAFSSTWLEPLAPDIFDRLPRSDQDTFVAQFVTRPIALSVVDHGRLFNTVAPHLRDDQWPWIIAALEELSLVDRLTILSAVLTRAPTHHIAAILERTIAELLQKPADAPHLDSINWSNLLAAVEPARRVPLVAAIASFAASATSSDYWLRVLPQALPFFDRPTKQAVVSQILSQGQLHHDEAAALPLLGTSIQYLPRIRQASARAQLAERVAHHVARVERSGAWRRLVGVGALLPFMTPSQSDIVANKLFEAQRDHGSFNVAAILEIIEYLRENYQQQSKEFLANWASALEAEFTGPAQLLEARSWLSEADFTAATERIYARARSETDPRVRAMALAYSLRLLTNEIRDLLVEDLVTAARHVEPWDESWTLVIRLTIEAAGPSVIDRLVMPFVDTLRTQQPLAAFSLFVQAALRHPPLRERGMAAALDMMPLLSWPLAELIEVLPLLRTPSQVSVLEVILRDLPDQQRGRPLGVLARIFPTLSEVAGGRATADLWEAIWDVTQWWP